MIRRSPCEYYIKYLLVHPDDYGDSEIEEILRTQQLDNIGMEYIERLRSGCTPPTPFYPNDELHFRSQRFLIREGIRTLYLPNDHSECALKHLQTPRAKEFIETSLICRSLPVWIAAVLTRKMGVPSTPESVDIYKHLFFNVDLVDSHELKTIIRKRVEVVDVYDSHQQTLKTIAWKTGFSDPRRVSAEMAITPLAGMMNEMRLGLMPTNVELAKVASAARLVATVGCLEGLMRGERPDRCRDLAHTAKLMHEMLETVGDPESELQASLQALALQTEAEPIPSIHQLTAGHHTVDVQPIDEREREEADV